jgi:pimeloyl-ACP methyl ester carboxylesterase
MAAIVLVHGAWAGAWIWKKIIPLLRAAGHDVHATTATGLGDRVHLADPATDLDTHITDVANVLEFEELTDVTLVGWSYGGMIITGVAERVPERLAQLVYLDANVPADGENSYDAELYSEEARAADRDAAEGAGMPGFLVIDPYVEWIRSLTPDPADQTCSRSSCPSPSRPTPSRSGLGTRRPRRSPAPSSSVPKAKETRRQTRPCATRTESGQLRVGTTESWGAPTWRRSTTRRGRQRRSCP